MGIKCVKLTKEEVLVCGKWRHLTKGTVEGVIIVGINVPLFLVPAAHHSPGHPGLKGHKTVVIFILPVSGIPAITISTCFHL